RPAARVGGAVVPLRLEPGEALLARSGRGLRHRRVGSSRGPPALPSGHGAPAHGRRAGPRAPRRRQGLRGAARRGRRHLPVGGAHQRPHPDRDVACTAARDAGGRGRAAARAGGAVSVGGAGPRAARDAAGALPRSAGDHATAAPRRAAAAVRLRAARRALGPGDPRRRRCAAAAGPRAAGPARRCSPARGDDRPRPAARTGGSHTAGRRVAAGPRSDRRRDPRAPRHPGPDVTDAPSVLDLDPGLAAVLPEGDRPAARAASPVCARPLAPGEWDAFAEYGGREDWLGLLLAAGFLSRSIECVGETVSEILGPGDLLRPWDQDGDYPVPGIDTKWRVLEPATIAVLDGEFAARIAPW